MYAAVVHAFGDSPRYESLPDPEAAPGEVVVDVLAAGLHPLVRAVAAGKHPTSGDRLPLVPGYDGVGRTESGVLVYFSGLVPPQGSMAERAVAPRSSLIPLPDGLDPATAAALVNPMISAWLALYERAGLQTGGAVLVLGATGNAGRAAVQLALLRGADKVVAVGRNAEALGELSRMGAHHTVSLDASDEEVAASLRDVAGDVDAVIDYLWGQPAEVALAAVADGRPDPTRLLRWVAVGSMAGPSVALQSDVLRRINVDIRGSGAGSAFPDRVDAALRSLIALLPQVDVGTQAVAVPLSEVKEAWNRQLATGQRLVLIPERVASGTSA
ncbi:zinc-binding alcohol dehydrogenase family protein [Streptomyces sp. NPDC088794]|uniref:quinone oxidoreductase family protein n=1 Tax=Streptomyces sp. NPDC088794 TaxID=3365902 RepID=UPI00380374B3